MRNRVHGIEILQALLLAVIFGVAVKTDNHSMVSYISAFGLFMNIARFTALTLKDKGDH